MAEPDVRFTLANERTLLAYQRTAIALMAGAIAVVHFFGDGLNVLLLAVAMLATAGIAGIGGYLHFREVDRAIREDRPISSGPTTHLVSVAMLLCLLIAAAYVVRHA